MTRPLTTFVSLLMLAALGCNGGGSSSSEGGIGGSGITRGVITATGSATVAGTDYDTDDADANGEIFFDGVPGSQDDFGVGMNAEVTGTRSGDTGVAERVDVDDAIEGPVASRVDLGDPANPHEADLTILDQTVRIEDGFTVFFDPMDPDFGFADVVAGDVVEVYGFRDGSGTITATRLEYVTNLVDTPNPDVELKGTVTNLADMDVPPTFELGAILVEYDAGGFVPMDGDFVEVQGVLADATTVDATMGEVELEEPDAGDVDDYEVEGIVSDFVSLADFLVDGQPVDAVSGFALFDPSDTGFVQDGARVEVEGTLEDGVVIAQSVTLRGGEILIAAEIDSVADPDFTLLGIEVETDGSTRFEDDDDCDELADLLAGDFVTVNGILSGNQVVATEIECEDDGEDVRLRGRVESFDGPGHTFTILGVVIPTDGGTEFDDFPSPGVDDETDFYAFLVTSPTALLEVEDDDDGDATSIDVADEVEYAEEDDDDD
ncbi:MAG: DUF5666 domain-containing protein [Myxococcota bacterium]